ncbi:glycogen/starch/alpha-glucan phosphorylase, partial [Priestia megaterium]
IQKEAGKAYEDRDHWLKMSLMNIAGSGYFSSDRTISEYAREIWKIKAAGVEMMNK